MEQIAQKICIYQIKVVPLHTVFIFEFDLILCYVMVGTPRSDCVGCFVVYLAKKIVHFTKNQLFYEKIVEKNCTYQKNVVPLHRLTTKTFTTMKKRNIFRTVWAVVSLALIAFVCYWWHKQGCGVWSLVAAISFYGFLSAGLMVAVEDVMGRR